MSASSTSCVARLLGLITDDHSTPQSLLRKLSRNTHLAAHAEPTRKTTPHAHPFVRANTRSRAHLQAHTDPRAHTRAPPTCTHADARTRPPTNFFVGPPREVQFSSLAPDPRLARTVLARCCEAPPAVILTEFVEVLFQINHPRPAVWVGRRHHSFSTRLRRHKREVRTTW
jgi:hypothetical protein